MDQSDHAGQPYSVSPPSSYGAAPVMAVAPARPQVVQIVARPGGFWRAVMFIISLALFAGVFLLGLFIGIAAMFVGGNVEDVVLKQTYRDGGARHVAILPIVGPIDDSRAGFAHAAVNYILQDSSIDAVVLRVDSPGGGVSASDEIWYEIERLKRGRNGVTIPVVASYGGVAASGGYYVSCGADHIMAEETCITGSIGVIAQVLTLRGLMDKVGIEPVTIVASGSPEKDVANDIFRHWNENDHQKVLTILDSAYDTFTKRVQTGRKNSFADPSKLAEIANGSIYTAKQAMTNGLVDSVGYLDDAIAKAETMAGMAAGGATVVMLHEPPTFFGERILGRSSASESKPIASMSAESLRSLVNELASPRAMYLMR